MKGSKPARTLEGNRPSGRRAVADGIRTGADRTRGVAAGLEAAAAPSAARRIEGELTEQIAAGLIEPGARLDETALANRFGTSRTPVREALSRLAASGLAEHGGGRGLRVASLGREELAQMFEAMQEIETICAGLAAKRMTFLARAEIEGAQARCHEAAEAGDRDAYLRANEAFHRAIYDATQNRYVAAIATDFRRRTGPFRASKLVDRDDLIASAQSHDELLETIFSTDHVIAERGMRDHLRQSYMRVLASQ